MNEALVDLKGMALVSEMTGQDVNPKTLKPLIIFLAALVTILVGVIAIDGVIAEEEEHHLQTLMNALIPPGNPVYPQVQQMIQRVEAQQIYLNPHHLQTLIVPLSESERLLLLGLGYEIAAADGEVDVREKLYLQAIAQRLTLAPQYQNVLEAAFVGDRAADAIALNQVKLLLNPDLFSSLDIVCVNLAQNVLSMLPG